MVEAGDPLRDYYAARAAEYDRVYAKPERQEELREIEAWLPTLFAGASVLEVACGTGWWTEHIARSARRVVALDAAPETLAIARARVRTGTVDFVHGDAYDLPRKAEPCEHGFAGFWISHVPKARRTAFLRGLHAALAPRASVVLLDNRYVEGSSSPIAERDDEGNTYQHRKLADGSVHRVMKNFPEEAELRALVAALGTRVSYFAWPHFWALRYEVAAESAPDAATAPAPASASATATATATATVPVPRASP